MLEGQTSDFAMFLFKLKSIALNLLDFPFSEKEKKPLSPVRNVSCSGKSISSVRFSGVMQPVPVKCFVPFYSNKFRNKSL